MKTTHLIQTRSIAIVKWLGSLALALTFALTLVAASTAQAQVPCGPTVVPSRTLFVNWPQYQYDGGHSGCNPYERILNPGNVQYLGTNWQWSYDIAEFGPSIVANGILYTMTGNYLYAGIGAFNAYTGEGIWGVSSQRYGFSTPAAANGMVYFGSSDNNVYALDANTGSPIWNYATGGAVWSPPTIANGVVYVTSLENNLGGNLYALNATTGALLWRFAVGTDITPAAASGIVYVTSTDPGEPYVIYALNGATGELIWEYPVTGIVRFAVANGLVFVSSSSEFYALNAATGTLIWTSALGGGTDPITGEGAVYEGGWDGTVYALNASTGATIWQAAAQGSVLYNFAISMANGVVYVTTDYYLSALDAHTGALLFSYKSPGNLFNGPAAVVNSNVYFNLSATQHYGVGSMSAFSLVCCDAK